MYDYNIFREFKKIMETKQREKFPFEMGQNVYAYSPNMIPPKEGTIIDHPRKGKIIARDMKDKREFFEKEVREGRMSPEEFHHYALHGEYVTWEPYDPETHEKGKIQETLVVDINLFSAFASALNEDHTHKDLLKLSVEELKELKKKYEQKMKSAEGEELESHKKEIKDIENVIASKEEKK